MSRRRERENVEVPVERSPSPLRTLSLNTLNLQHLLYFWTVAREGTIARATQLLHVTQPTISGQLRLLERSIGEKLFVRRGRLLALTDVGDTVFRYADEIFTLGTELVETLNGQPPGHPQRFVIGIADSLPKVTTYRLLEPVLAMGDALHCIFRIDKSDRLLADLAVHAIDLVLSDTPLSPTIRVKAYNHLLGECGVTIFGTAAVAARYRRSFPQSLDGAPMVIPTGNTALRRSFDAWCADSGVRPRIVCEVEDVALLQVLGQAGVGLFAAPTVVEADIRRRYDVRVIGRLDAVRERFYAISVERRLTHPAVVAMQQSAKTRLFG
jgi:LysR family transcriptional regulator, transcriptional activator of nhaA